MGRRMLSEIAGTPRWARRLVGPSVAAKLALGALTIALAVPSTTLAQDASLDAEARALFEAGRTAFDAGRYEDALAHFEGAYRRSQRPQLLYNVAVAADRAGRVREAIVAYEKFLESVPDDPQRASLEARLQELRALPPSQGPPATTPNPFGEVSPEPPPASVPVTPATPATPPAVQPAPTTAAEPASDASTPTPRRAAVTEETVISPRSRVPGVVLVAGGGALALAGVASILSARALATRVEETDAVTWAAVEDDADRVPRREAIGYVLLGVGVVAAGAGLVQLLLPTERARGRADGRANEGTRVRARVGLGSLTIEGTF